MAVKKKLPDALQKLNDANKAVREKNKVIKKEVGQAIISNVFGIENFPGADDLFKGIFSGKKKEEVKGVEVEDQEVEDPKKIEEVETTKDHFGGLLDGF